MTAQFWVVVQKWEESERHWGIRPDGYSLHCTPEDRDAFVQAVDATRDRDSVPDEYDRTCGEPYFARVDEETYAKVAASGNGVRIYNNNYPEDGGSDGWKNLLGGGFGLVGECV